MTNEQSKSMEDHPDYPIFQEDIRQMSFGEPIWDSPAAIWAWRAWQAGRVHERVKKASLGELLPDGLTDKQKIKVLEQCRRLALLAFKRIAQGKPDPAKYADLTIMHLDTPSSEYRASIEITAEDIERIMDEVVSKDPDTRVAPGETTYWVRLSELCTFVSEILKKARL